MKKKYDPFEMEIILFERVGDVMVNSLGVDDNDVIGQDIYNWN